MENRMYPVIVNTLKMKDENFEIDYPQVCCLMNPEAQENINRTIINTVYELIQKQGPYQEMVDRKSVV